MSGRYGAKEVFVISSNENFQKYVRENLPSRDYIIADETRSGTDARQKMMNRGYTFMLINIPLSDESGTELASDFAENPSNTVVVIVKHEQEDELRQYLEPNGVFVLGRPFAHAAFHQVMYDAAAAHARMQAAAVENQRLQTKLLDLRIINRAKYALIQYLGMTEDQAHKYIEQQAMNMRISKRTAAENVLKTYEQ